MQKKDPEINFSAAFEEVIAGKQLDSGTIETQVVSSQPKCALFCNRIPLCRSFSICDNYTCNLYRDDIFSTQDGENILNTASNCKYYAMTKRSVPVCEKDGNFMDIQSDEGMKCRIRFKRVDRIWSQWESFVETDTSSEWKQVSRRVPIVDTAHGGIGGDETAEKLSWIKFIRSKLTWHEAKLNCIKLGGTLFANLNGRGVWLRKKLNSVNDHSMTAY